MYAINYSTHYLCPQYLVHVSVRIIVPDNHGVFLSVSFPVFVKKKKKHAFCCFVSHVDDKSTMWFPLFEVISWHRSMMSSHICCWVVYFYLNDVNAVTISLLQIISLFGDINLLLRLNRYLCSQWKKSQCCTLVNQPYYVCHDLVNALHGVVNWQKVFVYMPVG